MEFSLRYVGNNIAIVSVIGEVDAATKPPLQAEVTRLLEEPDMRLVLDLTEVTFMDSGALGLLIEANNRSQETGGRFALVGADPVRLRVLWLTGLAKWLPLHDDLDTAVDSVSGSAELS